MSKKIELDYLDDERKKLWAELLNQREEATKRFQILENQLGALTDSVEKKTSDYEREVKSASTQTTKYKNRAEESAKRIEASADSVEKIIGKAESIENRLALLDTHHEEATLAYEASKLASQEIQQTKVELATRAAEITATLEEAEEHLESSEKISAKLDEVKLSVESLASKITTLHSHAAKRGQELTALHDEVFGYSYKDEETGEEKEEEGLKAELDGVYTQLKKGASELVKELADLKIQKAEEYKTFEKAQSLEFEKIKEKIRGLLPQAMTAGLSYAYEEKRKSEELEGVSASKRYWWSIVLLLSISILPVIVSLYSFFHEQLKLDQIIHNLPQVAVAVLPLYAPAFWFAISASMRIKLAKRLTEEYAHKEALSKTFEGLSTQIASLPDSEVSRDLRAKLLYNIISVSSENPGKLITDYNKSDNPLLDVIDKSLSLSRSLEKISSIPGISRIMKKVEQNRVEKLHHIEESVDANIVDPDRSAA